MDDKEMIINAACGSLALEGLIVPEELREMARKCLDGAMDYDEVIRTIIARYTENR